MDHTKNNSALEIRTFIILFYYLGMLPSTNV